MNAVLSLELASNPAELQRLVSAIEEFGERENWSSEAVFKVNLVLEELVINIMTHGSRAGLAEIGVTIISAEDLISIEISDNGLAFDPLTESPEPDLTGSIEDRPVGGLGVHFVRTMMNEVSYRRELDRNLLVMTTQRS